MSGASTVDVATLVGVGIDEELAHLWQAMHTLPGAGVEDLAAFLDRPEGEVRRALDALADLALVRASIDRPGQLVPVSGPAGLELLIRRQEAELEEQRRHIEAQREKISAAIATQITPAGGAPGRADSGVEHLVGQDAIQARFESLAFSLRTSADSMMPGAALPVARLEAARPLDLEVLRRGVVMRSIYQEAIRNDSATIAYVRDMADRGTTIRTAPVLEQRLWLGDNRVAMVPLDASDLSRGYASITEPGVIASLRGLFEYIWRNAAPLDVGNPVAPETGLTDTERELLAMLAAGMTDEAAGKRLGVSLRTVRRIMADLMMRLDAGSRFEAGIKAAKKGWL